jgi:XRE family transcriptional regulator, regulator of sulfur utilization
MLTARDTVVAVVAAACTLGVSAAARSQATLLPSSAFDWTAMQVRQTAVGAVRQVVRAPTATLVELEMHITTLNAGQTSHPPHQHPNEELIIVREGTVEALVNGEWKRLGPGSIIFQATNQPHAIRNAGDGPTTYHVINWKSASTSDR